MFVMTGFILYCVKINVVDESITRISSSAELKLETLAIGISHSINRYSVISFFPSNSLSAFHLQALTLSACNRSASFCAAKSAACCWAEVRDVRIEAEGADQADAPTALKARIVKVYSTSGSKPVIKKVPEPACTRMKVSDPGVDTAV